jgi:quinolinate synthase
MKRNTLENILKVLQTGEGRVEIDEATRLCALLPLERMLELGK